MGNETVNKIEKFNDLLLVFLVIVVSFKGSFFATATVIFLHNIYHKLSNIVNYLDTLNFKISIEEIRR